jgi:hypothetical protein
VANAQYLYLIRRLSALRFSEESDDMGDLMSGSVVRTGERSELEERNDSSIKDQMEVSKTK